MITPHSTTMDRTSVRWVNPSSAMDPSPRCALNVPGIPMKEVRTRGFEILHRFKSRGKSSTWLPWRLNANVEYMTPRILTGLSRPINSNGEPVIFLSYSRFAFILVASISSQARQLWWYNYISRSSAFPAQASSSSNTNALQVSYAVWISLGLLAPIVRDPLGFILVAIDSLIPVQAEKYAYVPGTSEGLWCSWLRPGWIGGKCQPGGQWDLRVQQLGESTGH